MTESTRPLQEKLYREIVGHVLESDTSAPFLENGWLYYTRTEAGRQYPIFCRRAGDDAAEQVTLDVNVLAEGKAFMAVGDHAVSDDGRLLAYSTDETGERQFTLFVKDLATGAIVDGPVENVAADSAVWAADGRTLFYVWQDDAKRPCRLYRREPGGNPDVLVYEEADERFDVGIDRSRSGVYLFLSASSHTSAEVRVGNAAEPAAAFRLIAAREADHEYDVDHQGDLFFIRSNGGAGSDPTRRNFRMVTAPASDPGPGNWREIVPSRAEVMIEGTDCFARHVVRYERERGLPRIVVTGPDGGSHAIAFSEPVYAVRPTGNREYRTRVLRYDFESLVTPPSVFDYDMDARAATLRKAREVPGYDAADYRQERIEVVASDGARIPVSLVCHRSVSLDGSAPMDLWGYGSYGLNFPIRFDAARLPLLDRGVIVAAAHIRGGAELGKNWHDAGRMAAKKNTFTDFVAAAEFLVENRYTSSERLVIEGRSAGGLLMGAVMNLRPELFRAVITAVPFVDVVSTMLDETLPLTITEYEEWGNPNVADEYAVMRAYSPYDNLERGGYPAVLVLTSLNDSQVPYWEPAKLVAKLRTLQTADRPILLRTNMSAGHGGASGRYDAFRERAFEQAFLLRQVGIEG
jgi:oligopeptidase B